jgi:cation:H+ antiporter
LPELIASTVAAYKRDYALAIGNVIGSNIFDFLLILGLASAMKPMPFEKNLFIDLGVTGASALLLFLALFSGKKYTLERWQGALFVSLYALYILYSIFLRR